MNSTLRKTTAAMLMALPMFASAEPAVATKPKIIKIIYADAPKIFGEARANLDQPNTLISGTIAHFATVRSRSAEDVAEIDKDTYFLPGCRPRSCDEKGAVIVDFRNEKLLASALRHFNCKSAPPKGESSPCDDTPSLLIYLVNDPQSVAPAGTREKHLEILRSWSKEWGPYRNETVLDIKRD